ncbi:MAG: PAS domain S-box protein [Sphingomonas sp.]
MSTEADRLAALHRHALLDTPFDAEFDEIVALVRTICDVPIALISLVDTDRQWFKACSGVEARETPIDTSVCALAIRQRDVFQIEDLAADPRTAGMSLVTAAPHLRFYAGAPLVTSEGEALGSLCAIDTRPRPGGLGAARTETLQRLANQVVRLIELRTAVRERELALARDEALLRADMIEDRHHAIVDSAIDSAIIAIDADGRVTSWSRGAEGVFGWTEAEMLGQPAERIFTDGDRTAGIPAREYDVARAMGRASDERWHVRKDGSLFYAHGALSPLKDVRQPGFVKAVRDITLEHERKHEADRNRQRAEMVTRAARLGTFDFEVATGTLVWDDRCRELFGLPPHAPVSYETAFLAGIHPEDRASADAAVAAALSPGGTGSFETDYRTIGLGDGKLRHVEARGQAYFDEGRPVRLIGIVQDVTQARRADAKLRETQQRLSLANRATNDAIWDWNLLRDHVSWNEALERGLGYRPEMVEPTGAWWIDHIHPDDRARIDASIHATIDGTGTDWSDEYRFRRADGSYADIRDRGYVLRDEQGRAVRMIGAMLDQSERKAVERRLLTDIEAGEAQLDRLWRSSPDLQLALTPDGTIREVNAAWTTILGYAPEELIGQSFRKFILADDLAASDEALRCAADAVAGRVENRYRDRQGNIRWFSWVSARDGDMVLATGRHITAQKQAEETLRQTEDALRQSQKVEAVGQLTGGVAHDFNNLLTVIRGSVDLLRRPGLSEERRARYVDAIADTAERATRLTSQLLSFARRQALKPEIFDAVASVERMRDMLRTLAGSRIALAYALPERPCFVRTDPSQFDTAIVNMAVNARDAMDGDGELSIRVAVVDTLPAIRTHGAISGQHVALSIRDTGSGIAPDKIEHIFEPFFTTKGVGHGTGLGLSQVFGFAKQSHGEVTVTSEVDRGSEFTLYLPLVPPPAADANGAEPARRMLRPGSCVLVVEDNEEVGAFATAALAELGYVSHWEANADAALEELARARSDYDVVFTDVVMPGRSGIELAEIIRTLYPGLPVVLASGYSHVLAQEGSKGFALLQKPYSLEELARILHSVAEPASA